MAKSLKKSETGYLVLIIIDLEFYKLQIIW